MNLIDVLLDIDLVINLFMLFSKKLPLKDALILTAITTALFYLYVTYKNKGSENS